MIKSELLTYIKTQLQAGFSKATIYQSLRESNWPDELINQAFALAENKSTRNNLPVKVKKKFFLQDKKKLLLLILLGVTLIGMVFFAWRVKENKKIWQKEQASLTDQVKENQLIEANGIELEAEIESTRQAIRIDQSINPLSPKEAWLEMKTAFRNLQSYDELEAYTWQYGDQVMIDNWQEQRQQVDKMSKLVKDQLVKLAQSVVPDEEITMIDETIKNDQAFLKVYTVKPKLTAEIKLIKRGEEWKLQSEEWISEE